MSDASELFLKNLPLIEQTLAAICRRKNLTEDESEEIEGATKLHLIENDYAVIRKFQGRSSLGTYLGAVVMRVILNERNRARGKWRKSAEARRIGNVGIELERLLYRDERSPEEAYTILVASHPELTRADVEALAARLPPRTRRRIVEADEALLLGFRHVPRTWNGPKPPL